MKLSKPQQEFLAAFARHGYLLCPGGYANASRDASAWWRTGLSLEKMGLVTHHVGGSAFYLTFRGLAFACLENNARREVQP